MPPSAPGGMISRAPCRRAASVNSSSKAASAKAETEETAKSSPRPSAARPPGRDSGVACDLDHQAGTHARKLARIGQDRHAGGQADARRRAPAKADRHDAARLAPFEQQGRHGAADGAKADQHHTGGFGHSVTHPAGGSFPGCTVPQFGQVRSAASA